MKKHKNYKNVLIILLLILIIFILLIILILISIINLKKDNQQEIPIPTFEDENNSYFKSQLKENIENLEKNASKDFSKILNDSIKSIVNIRPNYKYGTGFIVSSDGLIVTNNHITSNNKEVDVVFYNGEIKRATLLRKNISLDLAILKLEEGNYNFLEFEDSSDFEIGDRVISVGNPDGLFVYSEGIILEKDFTRNNLSYYIKSTAYLSNGNSGSPLINLNGKVIGMNSFVSKEDNTEYSLESEQIAGEMTVKI